MSAGLWWLLLLGMVVGMPIALLVLRTILEGDMPGARIGPGLPIMRTPPNRPPP